jgi:type II secretory pathway component PulM
MNKVQQKLALRRIANRLSVEEPELAAALRLFGQPGRGVRRRERRALVGAVGALAMLATLTFSFLWGPPTSYATSGNVAPTATASR